MSLDIFLEVDFLKEREVAFLNSQFVWFRKISYPLSRVAVFPPEVMSWSSLGDFIFSELQPHISKGHPPIIHFDEKVDNNGCFSGLRWEWHIPYLYSSHYVKMLDDILIQEGDKESYDRLSTFPTVMIREEEFNSLLKKLQEGIKNILTSSGCEIYHDFNGGCTNFIREDLEGCSKGAKKE